MKCTGLLTVVACFGILVACNSSPTSTGSAASQAGPPTVQVTPVVAKKLDMTVNLPGELEPYEAVAIYPKVVGFVQWIGVDRGSHVRSGQPIARLVAPELVSQRAEAQSKAEGAQSQLAAGQAKMAGDESTYAKLQAAAKTPGVVAGNDLLLAQKAVEADQAQVKALSDNVQAAQQALRAVSETEQYLRITAPFEGVITERNIHPGALVGPNTSIPMLRVETLQHLRLVVPVPETYIAAVPEGSEVEFTVPAFPQRKFKGRIARISHAVDTKTRTMPVELDVNNRGGKLTPGSFSEVMWPVRRPGASLLVPSSAIGTNLERTFVVRVRNGKTEWVDVKPGASSGSYTEVFGDLQAGDEVAVRGTDELAPGTQVKAQRVATVAQVDPQKP
jgi:membrane fusion protein, multidrug efflux system